jgi:hypothetical protein
VIKHPKEGCVYLIKDGLEQGFWYGMCVVLPEYTKGRYTDTLFATFKILGKEKRGWNRFEQPNDKNKYWNVSPDDKQDGIVVRRLKLNEIPDKIWLEMI